jgi:Family of unknown function (DUF6551)
MPPGAGDGSRFDTGRQDVTRIHVRKARRSSVCPLCRGPIMTGQQISDGSSRGWVHVRCLITEQRSHVTSDKKDQLFSQALEFSYGEVGHDPPVHAVAGPWQGPAVTSRAAASNVSLCGKKLSRVRKRQPETHDLCRKCEDIMAKPGSKPPAPAINPTTTQDYEVLTIPLGSLFVDRSVPGLQRQPQEAWSRKIAASFSWARFNENPPKVSARADGRYHIMDGQHEVEGARLAGHGSDTLVRVHVWRGLTYQQEAELFGHTNRDRHTVRALDLFIADVTAGVPDAVALDVLLDTYKWKAGSSGKRGNFAAVTTLRQLYAKRRGPEICDRVVATITAAWDHDPDGANRTVVAALGAFYQKYPDARVDRLAHVLHQRPIVEIHKWPHSGTGWLGHAVLWLQGWYDNGLRDPKRRLVSPQ